MLGKIEGRRRGPQRMKSLDGIIYSSGKLVKDREVWHASLWSCKDLDITEQMNNNNNRNTGVGVHPMDRGA